LIKKREGNRKGARWGRIGEMTGGFWLNSPPFIPYLANRQRQGRAAERGASVRWPGGVFQGPTAAGGRGKE
jgi:hypothetical protein